MRILGKTKKLTCELKNGTGYYYLDDCYLAVNGGDLTTFTSYINGEIAGNASGQVLGKQIDEKKWDEVYKTIYQTSSCFLGNLSVDKKLQVLQQIAQESYIDDYKDHVVINILESICQDKAQSKSLIEWMDGHPKEIFIRNKLHKTEDGKKFLELWPTISIVTDIATLTTFVVVANKSAMLLDEVSSIERQTVNKQIERAKSLVAGKGKLNLGKFVKKIGDYEVYEGGEVFYRAMKKEHYESLLTTKKLTASSETFTSPTAIYSENYEGYLVKFSVKQGTIDKLKAIGVSDGTDLVKTQFGDMPTLSSGWGDSKVFFKKETKANITPKDK